MKPPFTYLPALPAAIGWVAGILLWYGGMAWWGVSTALAIGVILFILKKPYIAFGVVALCGGWAAATLDSPGRPPAGALDGRSLWYAATVIEVMPSPNAQTTILEIDSMGTRSDKMVAVAPFRVGATSLPDWVTPVPGDAFKIKTDLRLPDKGASFPFDPSRRAWLLSQGIEATAFVQGDSVLTLPRRESVGSYFAARRAELIHLIALSPVNDDAFALLCALLVGADEDLSPSVKESFRAVGAAHALALSGFHLGIIIMLASLAVFPLRASLRLRPLRLVLILAMIWAYTLFTGMPLSLARAAAMYSVFTLARLIGRRTSGFNSLCVAVLVILAASPRSLFATGFQLSVCAVAGILAFSEGLNPFSPTRRIAHAAAMYVTLPVGALLATVPLTVWLFHVFPLMFILSNIVIAVLLPPFMIFGIIETATLMCGSSGSAIAPLLDWLAKAMSTALGWLSAVPATTVALHPTLWQCLALGAGVCALAVGLNMSSKGIRVSCMAVVLLATGIQFIPPAPQPIDEMLVININGATPVVFRHSDSIVVVPGCHPRQTDGVAHRVTKRLSEYIEGNRVLEIRFTDRDFTLGPFRRTGDLVTWPGGSMAIIEKTKNKADTLPKIHVDYALVTSRFRGGRSAIFKRYEPDSLILSQAMSPVKANSLAANSPVPVIRPAVRAFRIVPELP